MKHITIVTPVRSGVVADISSELGAADINIESLEAFAVREWGHRSIDGERRLRRRAACIA